MGLTENKQRIDQDVTLNINLPGYIYLSQPSLTNAGGVGCFFKNDVKFSCRHDLILVEDGYESVWIEIKNDLEHDTVCGIIIGIPMAT